MTTTLLRNRMENASKIPQTKQRRSIFEVDYNRKQTLNASYITPIFCKKVVPNQTMYINLDAIVRLNAQLTCPMDNLQMETFFFYTPDRLVWKNAKNFVGAIEDPNQEQTDYLVPAITIEKEENTARSLWNLFSASRIGISRRVSALPFRMHNLIYNEYFRDTDCESPKVVKTDDSDDTMQDYDLYRIHKSRDYFTNSTRQIQRGEMVKIPLGENAPVVGTGVALGITDGTNNAYLQNRYSGNVQRLYGGITTGGNAIGTVVTEDSPLINNGLVGISEDSELSGLIAKLNESNQATIDSLRQSMVTAEWLEALNRTGGHYTSIMQNIYGVTIPDLTIQRPLYLGGTSTPIFTEQVVQTSGTGTNGQITPQGNIAGYGLEQDNGNVINASFQEFGWVIGYVVIKAQPQYQQGTNRTWKEFDKFEYWNPFFNNLSDQAILMDEIYSEDEDATNVSGKLLNEEVFGYIGKNDHMRYTQNEIAGEFNSEYQYSLDLWHYAEKFEDRPVNNAEFMHDKTYEILDRTLAVTWEDEEKTIKSPQLMIDVKFKGANTLAIPTNPIPKQTSGLY